MVARPTGAIVGNDFGGHRGRELVALGGLAVIRVSATHLVVEIGQPKQVGAIRCAIRLLLFGGVRAVYTHQDAERKNRRRGSCCPYGPQWLERRNHILDRGRALT